MARSDKKLVFISHGGLGGSTKVATRLANDLAAIHHVYYLSQSRPVDLDPSVCFLRMFPYAEPQVLLTSWSSEVMKHWTRQIRRFLVELRPDIVHVHYAVPFLELFCDTQFDFKLFVTFHGSDVEHHSQKILDLVPRIGGQCTFTAVSGAFGRQIAETIGVVPIVIPNYSIVPSSRKPRSPSFKIGHSTNFRPVKNTDEAIAIHKAARAAGVVSTDLMIAGYRHVGSPEAGVSFLGYVDPIEFHKQIDVLLVSSTMETFSLAILEAIRLGTPVVARRLPCLVDVYGDNVLFFNDLTEAVDNIDALRSTSFYNHMAQTAAAYCIQYSRDKIIPLWERAYALHEN